MNYYVYTLLRSGGHIHGPGNRGVDALHHLVEVVQRIGNELARHIICAFHPRMKLEFDAIDREEDHQRRLAAQQEG